MNPFSGEKSSNGQIEAFLQHPMWVIWWWFPGPIRVSIRTVPGCFMGVSVGSSRTQSVRNGLAALDLPPDTPVLIHDAARPGLSQDMISALIAALETADAVAPALPVPDALKTERNGKLETVSRDGPVASPNPSGVPAGRHPRGARCRRWRSGR